MSEKMTAANREFSNVGTVAIFVGVEKTRFDVHQDQLCKVSTFFKAAFTSEYKESSNKTMDLIEDDVDTVDLFIQWVYKQECNIGGVPIDDAGEMWMQPMRLLIFADKYDIPSFKLDTIETLVAHIQHNGSITPSKTVAEYVYDSTCRGSGIRQLLADWYATRNPRKWFQMRSTHDWLLSYPELAVDLVFAFSEFPDAEYLKKSIRFRTAEYYMNVQEDISGSDIPRDGPRC